MICDGYIHEISQASDWSMRLVDGTISIELHRRVWTPDLAWCLAESILSLVASADARAARSEAE